VRATGRKRRWILSKSGPKACDISVAVPIAGISPRLPLDVAYRGFLDFFSAALNAALTRVAGLEEERKRAEMLAAIDRAKTVFFSNVSQVFSYTADAKAGPA
jgi:hypothetical protein